LTVAMLVLSISVSFGQTGVFATPEGKKAAEEKKAEEEKKKSQAEGDKADTESYINELNSKAASLKEQAAEVQAQCDAKTVEISEINKKLDAATVAAKNQYTNMRKRIKLMYEKGTSGYLEAIFSSGSISEMLNRAQYISEVFGFDKKLVENYNNKVSEIKDLKAQLEEDKKELESLNASAKEKIKYANESMATAQAELKAYVKSISDSEEKIKEYEKEIIAQGASVGTGTGKTGNQTTQKEIIQGDGVSVTSEELDMMAAMIYCEAGAEGFEEMLGVASVIVNRLKSSKYPNTMEAVLWQKGQFAPTWEGKFAKALAKGAPPVCYEAARKALSGYSNVGTSIGFKLASTGIEGIVIGKIVFFG